MNQPPLLPTPDEEALARALAGTAAKVVDCERAEVQAAWRSALQPLLERLERDEQEADDDQAAIERALFGGGGGGSAAAARAAASAPPNAAPSPSQQDPLLVRRLLRLFKREGFFSWVDSPPCPSCSAAENATPPTTTTAFTRYEPPTQAERQDDPTISRVEVHTCRACGHEARFPRHASALKLLQTRRGRCGEWAHAFLAALRSLGVEARHCQDREDHVWTEYWLSSENRWCHLDCCEAAHDTPHLYERGWGKKQTFVVAVGRLGAADVSLRYAGGGGAAASAGGAAEAQLQALRERRQGVAVREAWLGPCLARLSRWLRRKTARAAAGALSSSSPPVPRARERRRREAADALDLVLGAWGLADGGGGGKDDDSFLGGRTSGSAAWRAARGEDGGGAGGSTAAAAAPSTTTTTTTTTTTPWAWAREAGALRDAPALAAFCAACGRVSGGAARASADNAAAGETAAFALEGRAGPGKWLAFLPFPNDDGDAADAATAAAPAAAATTTTLTGHGLEYRLPRSSHPPVALRSYDLVSANDAPERDPCDWVLERWCCEDDDEGDKGKKGRWLAVDARTGERFSRRQQLRSFFVPSPPSSDATSRAWRLRVTRVADGAAANSVQLSGWNLYGEVGEGKGEEEQQGAPGDTNEATAAADAARALRALASAAAAPPTTTTKTTTTPTVSIPGARALRLAADPLTRAALAAAGFRPLAGQGGTDASLVADAGAEGARERAEAALKVLGVDLED